MKKTLIILLILSSFSYSILRKFSDYSERWYQGYNDTTIGLTNEPTNNYFGIHDTTPTCELEVNGTINASVIAPDTVSSNLLITPTLETITANANEVVCTTLIVSHDLEPATSLNVGAMRYYTTETASFFQVCIQTNKTTYSWYTVYWVLYP